MGPPGERAHDPVVAGEPPHQQAALPVGRSLDHDTQILFEWTVQ